MQLFDMWWIYLGYLVKADLPPGGFEARARRQRRNEVDRTLQRGRESRSSLGSTACTILPSGQIGQRWQYWKVAPQFLTHFTAAVIINPQYVHTDPPFTPQEVDSQAGLASGNRKIAQILDEEGRGSCYEISQNPAIVKIDSTPHPPLPQSWHTALHWWRQMHILRSRHSQNLDDMLWPWAHGGLCWGGSPLVFNKYSHPPQE